VELPLASFFYLGGYMPHFIYINPHSYCQILRVTDSFGFYLERVVAPLQKIEFDTVSRDAKVEIITGEFITALISDRGWAAIAGTAQQGRCTDDHCSCSKLEQAEGI
jgi:hypothetical protein